MKTFTRWQPAARTAIVYFTSSDHGASAYRTIRCLLGIDPIAPEWAKRG